MRTRNNKRRGGYSTQRNTRTDGTTEIAYTTGATQYVAEYDPSDLADAGNPDIHIRIRNDRDYIINDIKVNTYRDYARGKHSTVLTDKQKQILRNLLGNRFCDNICGQVLESSNSRLDVQRLECQNEETQKWLEDWFVTSELKSKARNVHFAALRDGNTILALNWSNRKKDVCLYPEDWWNGSEGVFVAYNEDGEMLYGVKEWIVRLAGNMGSGVSRRRNIWFPDRLERWQGNGMEWNPYSLPQDDGQWPVPYTDRAGNPLGVPYVHFSNSGKGEKTYGISDIDGVIGFNDQLNDLQYSMSAAGRLTAYQMLFASGVTDKDETGKKIEFEAGPGKILTSPNAESRMNTLPAGDLSQLIALYDKKQSTVAIRTRTPIYEITAENLPSGEAIFQAQQPATAKAQENIDKWTPQWSKLAYKAVIIRNAYAEGPELASDEETAMVTAVMSPADRRDKLTMSVIVNNLGDVVSKREKLRLLGYAPDQIDTIMQEMEEEARTSAVNAMVAFSRGTARGTELPGSQGGLGPNNPEPGGTRSTVAG